MKKAFLVPGKPGWRKVRTVWPWTKTLPDGTQMVKTMPPMSPKALAMVVDCGDEVKVGWRYDEASKTFSPPPKIVKKAPELHQRVEKKLLSDPMWSALVKIVAKRLNTSPQEIIADMVDAHK